MILTGGCFSSEQGETYYGNVIVPQTQELRWSNGGLPRVFDPARAAAAPDTDAVRAMFEGLTDYDPRTLAPVPAVAVEWSSSPDHREWTFHLRSDARWSNGDRVKAQDFVRSWQRALSLGDRAPHANLLEVIVNARPPVAPLEGTIRAPSGMASDGGSSSATSEAQNDTLPNGEGRNVPPPASGNGQSFGAEAIDDHTLRVRLQRSMPDFPALVAHPIFRPVHTADIELFDYSEGEMLPTNRSSAMSAEGGTNAQIVTNGAFRLSEGAESEVVLERAANYWDAEAVMLNRVRFVATPSAEAALAAYRRGEIDAVTNAAFTPLAVKLLAPYKDFRRVTFGAVNYYVFNTRRTPFDDLRVREALSIAVDRERLSRDRTGDATEPARTFLPRQTTLTENESENAPRANPQLSSDVARARQLLAEAGFPEGRNFPRIRLLLNRNDQQRAVAEFVAAMWKNALGIDTEIIVKNWDEYEAALRAGDYDLARRSMVMQTVDETTNMLAMFSNSSASIIGAEVDAQLDATARDGGDGGVSPASPTPVTPSVAPSEQTTPVDDYERNRTALQTITTEEQAFEHLPAIPIYFASSYALVKPYVVDFDSNLLDARSLRRVRINSSWQASPEGTEIRVVQNQ